MDNNIDIDDHVIAALDCEAQEAGTQPPWNEAGGGCGVMLTAFTLVLFLIICGALVLR